MRQLLRSLRWPIVLALVACASYVWNVRSVRASRTDLHRSRSQVLRMMPVRFTNGIAGRSIVPLPAGDCVVLHVPPQYLDEQSIDNPVESDGGGNGNGRMAMKNSLATNCRSIVSRPTVVGTCRKMTRVN